MTYTELLERYRRAPVSVKASAETNTAFDEIAEFLSRNPGIREALSRAGKGAVAGGAFGGVVGGGRGLRRGAVLGALTNALAPDALRVWERTRPQRQEMVRQGRQNLAATVMPKESQDSGAGTGVMSQISQYLKDNPAVRRSVLSGLAGAAVGGTAMGVQAARAKKYRDPEDRTGVMGHVLGGAIAGGVAGAGLPLAHSVLTRRSLTGPEAKARGPGIFSRHQGLVLGTGAGAAVGAAKGDVPDLGRAVRHAWTQGPFAEQYTKSPEMFRSGVIPKLLRKHPRLAPILSGLQRGSDKIPVRARKELSRVGRWGRVARARVLPLAGALGQTNLSPEQIEALKAGKRTYVSYFHEAGPKAKGLERLHAKLSPKKMMTPEALRAALAKAKGHPKKALLYLAAMAGGGLAYDKWRKGTWPF